MIQNQKLTGLIDQPSSVNQKTWESSSSQPNTSQKAESYQERYPVHPQLAKTRPGYVTNLNYSAPDLTSKIPKTKIATWSVTRNSSRIVPTQYEKTRFNERKFDGDDCRTKVDDRDIQSNGRYRGKKRIP
jgi:hypothetical protein